MINLDRSVKIVMLQFSFSNPKAIPQAVKRTKPESPEEQNERKDRSTGMLIIGPTHNCSLAKFVKELEANGYEISDAFYKERIDPSDPRGKRKYHMVRFLFARRELADISDEFQQARNDIQNALAQMCRLAMWQVRVFLNPFYKNKEEIQGQCAVSINLVSRRPLFHSDGQPITVWQKDEKGKRVGEAPLPLKPDNSLRILNGSIQVAAIKS